MTATKGRRRRVKAPREPLEPKVRKLRRQVVLLVFLMLAIAVVAWLQPMGYTAAAANGIRHLIRR
jgi:hypothetical protein